MCKFTSIDRRFSSYKSRICLWDPDRWWRTQPEGGQEVRPSPSPDPPNKERKARTALRYMCHVRISGRYNKTFLLQGNEARIYELVVRHFLACVSQVRKGPLRLLPIISLHKFLFLSSSRMLSARRPLSALMWPGRSSSLTVCPSSTGTTWRSTSTRGGRTRRYRVLTLQTTGSFGSEISHFLSRLRRGSPV